MLCNKCGKDMEEEYEEILKKYTPDLVYLLETVGYCFWCARTVPGMFVESYEREE